MVLACGIEDTTAVDLEQRSRGPPAHRVGRGAPNRTSSPSTSSTWRGPTTPSDDDLAQPEAVTVSRRPPALGTFKGRRARGVLRRVVIPAGKHLLGFPGTSAPYWEFRGMRPVGGAGGPQPGAGALPPSRRTTRSGRASAGPGATTGSRWRTAGPCTRLGGDAARPAVGKGPRRRARLPPALPRGGTRAGRATATATRRWLRCCPDPDRATLPQEGAGTVAAGGSGPGVSDGRSCRRRDGPRPGPRPWPSRRRPGGRRA